MSFYKTGSSSRSELPFAGARNGISLVSQGMRRGSENLYRTGIVGAEYHVGGAMETIQSVIMDLVHIMLLIAGGIALFTQIVG